MRCECCGSEDLEQTFWNDDSNKVMRCTDCGHEMEDTYTTLSNNDEDWQDVQLGLDDYEVQRLIKRGKYE